VIDSFQEDFLRVDLPAAIFPHKKINFAEVLILVSAWRHSDDYGA
jgi:hypothetical protein